MIKKIFFILLINCFWQSKAQLLKDCSRCLTEIITQHQIEELSIDEVRFLMNDLYARKGFTFDNFNLQAHFVSEQWYEPVGDNQSIVFDEIETQNIELLKAQLKYLELQRNDVLLNIRIFKELLQQKEVEQLQLMFKFPYVQFVENDRIKLLETILEQIPLEKIHYYKSNGYYRISTDTGRVKTDYILRIEGNHIHFLYHSGGLSDIVEKRDQYTNLLPDEGIEFAIDWEFLFENNQLTFQHFITSK